MGCVRFQMDHVHLFALNFFFKFKLLPTCLRTLLFVHFVDFEHTSIVGHNKIEK